MTRTDREVKNLRMVSFHNFKSQNFKLSVSNPKSKYVAYVSVLSQISNCQGLGRKNKHEFLKTDRMFLILYVCIINIHVCIHVYIYIYIYIYTMRGGLQMLDERRLLSIRLAAADLIMISSSSIHMLHVLYALSSI